jgi:hypothetical protein
MRISNQAFLAAAVLSLCSGATNAAEAVNPDTLPKIECSSLRYSKDFLQNYPKAPAACLEACVYKGVTYLKVKAKVYVKEEPMLSIDLMDSYGNTLGTVPVRKPQSLRVIIDGKEVGASDLQRDEAVTIWVPQSMFDAQPAAAGH